MQDQNHQFQRDFWLVFPPPNRNLTELPCTINSGAFKGFLALYVVVFSVAIFLSFFAAAFQPKPIPRAQLLGVSVHSTFGMAFCLGTLVRDDFHALGNPGFWVCFALFFGCVLAHSLIMTETIKKLSMKTAPKALKQNASLVDQLVKSSKVQQFFVGVAGAETILMFVAFILIIPAQTSSTVFWSNDPMFYFRKEFFFCIGCLLASLAVMTFILVPVRHAYRVWRYCKDLRERTKSIIEGGSLSPRPVEVKKVALGAVDEAEELSTDAGSPLSGTPGFPKSHSSKESFEGEAPSPKSFTSKFKSFGGFGQGRKTLTKTKSKESLTDQILRPNKRRMTAVEIQRKGMLDFQHKMLQATIVGIILGACAVVMTILMCDERILGPITPLIFACLASGFFLEFFIVHLYFPENLLRERMEKVCPPCCFPQIQIDDNDSVIGDKRGSTASKHNVKAVVAAIDQ